MGRTEENPNYNDIDRILKDPPEEYRVLIPRRPTLVEQENGDNDFDDDDDDGDGDGDDDDDDDDRKPAAINRQNIYSGDCNVDRKLAAANRRARDAGGSGDDGSDRKHVVVQKQASSAPFAAMDAAISEKSKMM